MSIQDQLGGIWAKALGVKQVGPDDNFFALGGHSLLGVKLIGEIQDRLALDSELSLTDLFEHPTLADFARHLESLAMPSEESGSI